MDLSIFSALMKEYGLSAAVSVYIIKTVLIDPLRGSANKYLKAIENNTKEIAEFRKETNRSWRIVFHNIKEIRDKNGLGPVTKPGDLEN